MQNSNMNNQNLAGQATAQQTMAGQQNSQNQITAGQNTSMPANGVQPLDSKMPGFQRVQQQVATLRQTLQELMMNTQYADGEIVTATATLDAQLEDYSRRLNDKRMPSLRTY